MQDEISSMLDKQAIEMTTPNGWGFLSTLFLVPKNDGGQRPVKPLNRFVFTEPFKMEGMDLLRAGNWMAKVDLKDVYVMLVIQEEDRASSSYRSRIERISSNTCPLTSHAPLGSSPRP
jgi:hypothetical protein